MQEVKETLVLETVKNFLYSKIFEYNAKYYVFDFCKRSKDGYTTRKVNKQLKKILGEFNAAIEMANCCGYEVEWHFTDEKIIVLDDVHESTVHDLIATHHYYERQAESLC